MLLEDIVRLFDLRVEFDEGVAVRLAKHCKLLEHFGSLLAMQLYLWQMVPHILIKGQFAAFNLFVPVDFINVRSVRMLERILNFFLFYYDSVLAQLVSLKSHVNILKLVLSFAVFIG